MFWICLSPNEIDALLFLVQREREVEYEGEEDSESYQNYLNGQRLIQELYERLVYVLEREQ